MSNGIGEQNGKITLPGGAADPCEGRTGAARSAGTDDLVVLFDGVFLHRDELFEAWDLSFFLDVTFATVRKRAKERHGGDFESEEEIMERYTRRYIPGRKLYLARCKPRESADFMIDNNDWEKPRLTKGRFA